MTRTVFPFVVHEATSSIVPPLWLGSMTWASPPVWPLDMGKHWVVGRVLGQGLDSRGPLCQTYEDQHSSEEEEEEEESEDGEEDDDITSAESESSEEEGGEHGDPQTASRQQQLEWDDSTLSY